MFNVLVRSSLVADLPVLQQIEVAALTLFPPGSLPPSVGQPMGLPSLAAAHAAALLWVAEHRSEGPVGFLAAEARGDCLHIVEMDVHPDHGRQGVGTALLAHACQAARERGFRWLTLTTFAHLAWNAPFYARHGFMRVEEDSGMFAHLMEALRQERARGLAYRIGMARNAA